MQDQPKPLELLIVDPNAQPLRISWFDSANVRVTQLVHLAGQNVANPYYILIRLLADGTYDVLGIPQHRFAEIAQLAGYGPEAIQAFYVSPTLVTIPDMSELTKLYERMGVHQRTAVDRAMDVFSSRLGGILNRLPRQSSARIWRNTGLIKA